jgi:hypothetical protein
MANTETCEIEICLMINQDGEYVTASDESDLAERFNDDGLTPGATSVFKFTITVPLPQVQEFSATVPENGKELTLTIA